MSKKAAINPNLDLVNINAYIKVGEILSFRSQDIKRTRNSGANQGRSSGTNVRKMMCNNPNRLDKTESAEF